MKSYGKKVILTIDTEGPRGTDPVLYQIWGKVGNDYYGISQIIDICDSVGAKGLFFVDIPEIWDRGYDKIKDVILYIKGRGHDVGVHVHPHHMPRESRHFLYDFTKEEQRKIITECTRKYEEITGEYPKSFRAGKYGANRDTLDILAELGYKYDFSEFYSQKWCGISPEINYILPVKYGSLVEIPVTIFRSVNFGSFFQRYDKLEATDNLSELKHILYQYAETKNVEVLVLFLHSFSFLKFLKTPDSPTLDLRAMNRFKKIMNYVSQSDDFTFVGESDLKGVKVYNEDSLSNVVATKGFFRQLWYLYGRALPMIKTNKKSQLLVVSTVVVIVMAITTVCSLLF